MVVLTLALLGALGSGTAASAQTFRVLHTFSGRGDGGNPYAGLTIDRSGKLYGTTNGAGLNPAFRVGYNGAGWTLSPLKTVGGSEAPLVFGPDGSLYGTTFHGGRGDCDEGTCGVVFKLQPTLSVCRSFVCPWTETVLYSFAGQGDGGNPGGEVVFDAAGNIYGTTAYGGTGACDFGQGCGAVYKLTPSQSGWTESILYNFQGGSDGQLPSAGLIFDTSGNLYGTTANGGDGGRGTIFKLTPSDGGWTETILHRFQGSDGAVPFCTLVADASGNLYGTTAGGGANNGGAVFELANPGNWTYSLLHSFADDIPLGSVAFDSVWNIYGTTTQGGANQSGSVYKLTPSGGGWTAVTVHSFSFDDGGGAQPTSGVVFDSAGNFYGTTSDGGGFFETCDLGCGTVYEITP